MSHPKSHTRTRAQESTGAIERLYITMRHLFNRGFYKPMGISGETLRQSLLILRPEIYGSIAEEKIELQGLLYVMDRLPFGIEECRYINLTSDEGYKNSHFEAIIPLKRRRNCYRIDTEQMNIEITRGRSEIYDILTHLTFLYIESHKIMKRVVINEKGAVIRDWKKLEEAVLKKGKLKQEEKEIALTHTANFLGRTFEEVSDAYPFFASKKDPDRFLNIIYYLGKLAIEEVVHNKKRIITFSPVLRERLGHHIHGEKWAKRIKKILQEHQLLERPLHIISANMHSVMNTLYAAEALPSEYKKLGAFKMYEALSDATNLKLREKVQHTALKNGMLFIEDSSGTNIDVQIFDTAKLPPSELTHNFNRPDAEKPVLLVMDYAFGEQAYETMDELLKPYKAEAGKNHLMNVASVSIMGKAGILEGGKGDIMIPSAHVFEGTADNYPFENELTTSYFSGENVHVCTGTMITVLGTSLQNRDLLKFFHQSTWNVIGLEMEGAHYQKAIQAAARIRGSIDANVKVRYAYYASDNPLETGSTLASGGLGTSGVKPTYLITERMLKQILE
jgi:DNA polymerase III delta prime subunit